MNAWTVFTVAFAAVVLQAWISRRGAPHWYMGCIVPLIYGGVVAWMFRGGGSAALSADYPLRIGDSNWPAALPAGKG